VSSPSSSHTPVDLRGLSAHHHALTESFRLFERCLIAHLLPEAEDCLEAHRGLLVAHLQAEEELLLPIARERTLVTRARLVTLEGQHDKLQSLLGQTLSRISALQGEGNQWPDALLSILEVAGTYAHLSEHHHEAEERWLFPTLDAGLTAGERDELLGRFLGACAEALARSQARTARSIAALTHLRPLELSR